MSGAADTGSEGGPRGCGEQGRQVNRPRHVVKQKVEMRMDEKVLDILLPPGDEIVEADDLMALYQEAVAEMRT